MGRTVVISDLHIGARDNQSIIEQPLVRARLLAALTPGDTLVLLGDTVELARPGRTHALEVAAPILRELGEHLGPHGRIILVPGNHDHALVSDWVKQQGPRLAREALVPADASAALARVVRELGFAGTPVEVRYPGVWLAPRIWATHGHYSDSIVKRRVAGTSPDAYERRGGVRLSRVARLLRPWMAPLTAAVLDRRLQAGALISIARVSAALDVDADYVIFGHVHRLGPLPTDDAAVWAGPGGTPKLLNSGSWRYEPLLLHRGSPNLGFWPGGVILIEDGRPPRATSLLGEMTMEELVAERPPSMVGDPAAA